MTLNCTHWTFKITLVWKNYMPTVKSTLGQKTVAIINSSQRHSCWKKKKKNTGGVSVWRKLMLFANGELSRQSACITDKPNLTGSTLWLFDKPAASPREVWHDLSVSSDLQNAEWHLRCRAHRDTHVHTHTHTHTHTHNQPLDGINSICKVNR